MQTNNSTDLQYNHRTVNIGISSVDTLGVYSGGGSDGTSLDGAAGVVV